VASAALEDLKDAGYRLIHPYGWIAPDVIDGDLWLTTTEQAIAHLRASRELADDLLFEAAGVARNADGMLVETDGTGYVKSLAVPDTLP
jgi:hypothetical protein